MFWRFGGAASAVVCVVGLLAVGCGDSPASSNNDSPNNGFITPNNDTPSECTSNDECEDAEKPFCNLETFACEPLPEGHLIGIGDGSAGSVEFTTIYNPQAGYQATDLEFNPERPEELWVLQRQPHSQFPCTQDNPSPLGCGALEGVMALVTNPGLTGQTEVQSKVDPNSWHFMRRPPALAFGAGSTFGTCGEARTGNFLDGGPDFIGPTLWSSDLAIFAQDPGPGLNGSHLDMLHATPYCMGIAHEEANIYWTFNGNIGSLDRYDFVMDHGPGHADHSDGEVYRYIPGELSRVPDVPSHMVWDKEAKMLYVADTGNGRVVRFNPEGTVQVGDISPIYEPLAFNGLFEGGELVDIVPPGTLEHPSGLEMHDGILYVSDNATGIIHAFDKEGNKLRQLQTELTDGGLAGMTIGPDGKLYIADLTDSKVYRIDP